MDSRNIAIQLLIGVILVAALLWYISTRTALGEGEFLVEDPRGDRMVVLVDAERNETIDALMEMHRTRKPKWVGGRIEIYDNEFGFRFKPETVIVAQYTAEGLQAVYYHVIQEDFDYWQGLGFVYIEGRVRRVPR